MVHLSDVRSKLGMPYFEKNNFLLYNLDCLKGLKKIDDEIFDLTVTSPPYNIGKEYEEVLPLDEYINWCKNWMAEIYRITKPNGAFLLNIGYVKIEEMGDAVPLAYLLWNKTKFYLKQEIVWNYGAGVACKNKLSPRNEKLLWFVKNKDNYTFNLDPISDPDVKYPKQKKNGKLRCNSIGKNPSDVWQIAKVTSGTHRSSPERTPHPAQFPMDLIERVIIGFSNPDDTILDPFIGSGTVAEVAIKNSRKVVGFEIQKKYCDYTKFRINEILASSINLEKFL